MKYRAFLKSPWFLGVTFTIILVGCYTVPETGRSSLNFISSGEELSLGISEFEKLKQQSPISTDPVLNRRLQTVGRRIAEAVGDALPGAEWEFVLFDDSDTINAFALPGGKVGVYTGIMELASTDEELAVIVGHEIAHVTARHGSERMSHGMVAGLSQVLLGAAVADSDNRELYMAAFGIGTAYAVMLPYSRNHELEADEIGIIYAAKAGYNPEASIEFWMKMNLVKGGNEPPEWQSTHPSDLNRIDRLEAMMPRVKPIYEKNKIRYQ